MKHSRGPFQKSTVIPRRAFWPAGMTAPVASIAGHLQVSNPAMAALEADRSLPIRKAGSHPALCVQRDALDRKRQARNRNVPADRDLASFDHGLSLRRHVD